MRRKEREVKGINEIKDILENNNICRIAFEDKDGIYIVPLTYGYKLDDKSFELYFHGAKEGRKNYAFENKLKVGFEIDEINALIGKDDIGCSYTYYYKSIIGNGIASIVENFNQKKELLDLMMKNITKKENFRYNEATINNVMIFKLTVTNYCAKKHQRVNA